MAALSFSNVIGKRPKRKSTWRDDGRMVMRSPIRSLLACCRTIDRIGSLRHEQLTAFACPLGPELLARGPSPDSLGASVRASRHPKPWIKDHATPAAAAGRFEIALMGLLLNGQAAFAHRGGSFLSYRKVNLYQFANDCLYHHEDRRIRAERRVASCAVSGSFEVGWHGRYA